jgi:hypothetical protein
MDHFNITLQADGNLVQTRKGLQVSKQKHKGTSFVNSYLPQGQQKPQHKATASGDAKVDLSKPLERRWRFVNKEKDTPRKAVKDGSKVKPAPPEPQSSKAIMRISAGRARESASSKAPRAGPSDENRSGEERSNSKGPLSNDDSALPVSLALFDSIALPLSPKDQKLFLNFFFSVVPKKSMSHTPGSPPSARSEPSDRCGQVPPQPYEGVLASNTCARPGSVPKRRPVSLQPRAHARAAFGHK